MEIELLTHVIAHTSPVGAAIILGAAWIRSEIREHRADIRSHREEMREHRHHLQAPPIMASDSGVEAITNPE